MSSPQYLLNDSPPGRARWSRSLGLILLLGVLARLIHWWTVKDLPFFAQLIMDSQEYDRWAYEIFQGDWLGSEIFFQAPLYPYLLATLYSIFGHSYNAVYLFQIALSTVGTYGLFRAGCNLGGRDLGLAAAALSTGSAVLPFYDVQLLKESIAVSTVCFLLWALSAARSRPGLAPWLVAGLCSGILILLRENALLLLPLFFLLTLGLGSSSLKRELPVSLRRYGLLVLGTLLVLAPVALRNFLVGGEPLPTTFQGGTNFYIGNNPQADGTYKPIVAGKQIPVYERNEPIRLAEQAMGRSLTPAEVSSYWLGRSLQWIRDEPLAFAALQIRKLLMFWRWYEWPDAVDYYFVRQASPILAFLPFEFGGLMLLACLGAWQARRHLLRDFLPTLLFIIGWTGATVIFFIFSRYRLPIIPALALLGAVPVASTLKALRNRRRAALLTGSLLILAAVWLPRTVMPEPRMELVHYNLGVIHHQERRLQPAERHFREALLLNPDNFLAAMNLGRIAAAQRDWHSARRWFQQAEQLEPDSDDVKLNLGAVHMALRLPDAARVYLEQALEINDRHTGILHNLALAELALWEKGTGNLDRVVALNARVLSLEPNHPQARALSRRLEELRRP